MTYSRVLFGCRSGAAIAGLVLIFTGACLAAPEAGRYETDLGPVAVSDVSKLVTTGHGTATAALDGNKLSVDGTFTGLTTPATDAHLYLGPGIGMPGSPILDLSVSPQTSGTVSGSFTLDRSQIAALKAGRIYVQIDSQKAPAPAGNLWGWLLPADDYPGPDVPQGSQWFLPQYDMPTSVTHSSVH